METRESIAQAVPAAPTVRVHRSEPKPAEVPDVVDARFCVKHPRLRVTEQCVVCGRGICTECMRLFGYVCSPHCKEKAELQGIEVPVFEGQRDVAGAKEWSKIGLWFKLGAAVALAILGVWFWYAWFGSRPSPAFTVRFDDEPAKSGQSALCEPGQIVFIHGDKLARYDTKSKKQIWLRHAVDRKKLAAEAQEELKKMVEQKRTGVGLYADDDMKIPSLEDMIKEWQEEAETGLELRVHGHNIWVAGDNKLTRFDWDTGNPVQEIPCEGSVEFVRGKDTEAVLTDVDNKDNEIIRKVNLVNGEITTNSPFGEIAPTALAASNNTSNNIVAGKPVAKPAGPALPPGQLDPQKLAAQLANAPFTEKIAAPATLSVMRNQQRILNELASENGGPSGGLDGDREPDYSEHRYTLHSTHGDVKVSEKLVEAKVIEHNAMKAPPKKSALDGPVNVTQSMEVANEILNEMQRDSGLGKVVEDVSRYAVTVRDGSTKETDAWKGEVIGPPYVFPTKTLNVVSAGKTLIALDKTNKKKWESTLTYNLTSHRMELDEEDGLRGLGPVVERDGTLYVFDAGVLSAFDAASGNAKWRLPSVGISSLYFDNAGSIYVNSTTATTEKIKYSRQINVGDDTHDVLLKLDEKSGKQLWSSPLTGSLTYLEGEYIYMMSSYRRDEEEGSGFGMDTPSYLRIKRISPKNGRIMWEHFQQRGPLDVKFDKNTIQLVFKKEVQVLKFLSF